MLHLLKYDIGIIFTIKRAVGQPDTALGAVGLAFGGHSQAQVVGLARLPPPWAHPERRPGPARNGSAHNL